MKHTATKLEAAIEAAEQLAKALQAVNEEANKENTPEGALLSLIMIGKIKEAVELKYHIMAADGAYRN
mgnify:CR=1 FL=1